MAGQSSESTQAVFVVRERQHDPRMEEYLVWCEAEGVPYYPIAAPRGGLFQALQRSCLNYINRMLAGGQDHA